MRFLTLLGLDAKPGSADTIVPAPAKFRERTPQQKGRRRRGRIGERSPIRDEIGIAYQNAG